VFLHTELTGHSRLPSYGKSGSAEHLSALINLCLLIERHKKLILARVEQQPPIGSRGFAARLWHRNR
jgi:hypothetical protein